MTENLNIRESLEFVLNKVREHIKTETIIGEPIKIAGITLLPIIEMSVAIGCNGVRPDQRFDTGAAGIGGKVCVTAILEIKDGITRLIPIKSDMDMKKLLGLFPDILDTATQKE